MYKSLSTPFLPFVCFFRDFAFIGTWTVLPRLNFFVTWEVRSSIKWVFRQSVPNFFFTFGLFWGDFWNLHPICSSWYQFQLVWSNIEDFRAIWSFPSFLVITPHYLYCRGSFLYLECKLLGQIYTILTLAWVLGVIFSVLTYRKIFGSL